MKTSGLTSSTLCFIIDEYTNEHSILFRGYFHTCLEKHGILSSLLSIPSAKSVLTPISHPASALLISASSLLVAQSCLTFSNSMNWSLPGATVHGILQAIILGWFAIYSLTLLLLNSLVPMPCTSLPFSYSRTTVLQDYFWGMHEIIYTHSAHVTNQCFWWPTHPQYSKQVSVVQRWVWWGMNDSLLCSQWQCAFHLCPKRALLLCFLVAPKLSHV